ncbi:MAG: hypothetical protein WCJ39_08165 [bacterium]
MSLLSKFFGWDKKSKPSYGDSIATQGRYKNVLENKYKKEIKQRISNVLRQFAKSHRIDITDKYQSNKIGYESIINNISSSDCNDFIDGKYPLTISSKGIVLRRNNTVFVMEKIILTKNAKTSVCFVVNKKHKEEWY